MKKIILSAAFAGLFGLTVSLAALAADSTVLRVLAVQTNDVQGYTHEVEALQALYRKSGQQVTLRVWRATYAGADTGTIVVTAELPNLAALAKMTDSMRSNPEIGAEMNKLGGMRKIVSDSLYELLAP